MSNRLKTGTAVCFQRRNGQMAVGHVAGYEQRANGLWVRVYTGSLRSMPSRRSITKPSDFTNVRPSELRT